MALTVLISGRGSNMQALHEATVRGDLQADISHVIANRPDAAGLDYARKHGIKTSVIDHTAYVNRVDFDRQLLTTIETTCPTLVLLAGFMRMLSAEFTDHFASRLLNIHPSLLPRHPGLDTHASAIACGDQWHGCSIHLVTAELDAGPIIARSVVPVTASDNAETLADRVLVKEHQLYWRVCKLVLEGSIRWRDGHVKYCGNRLVYPLTL